MNERSHNRFLDAKQRIEQAFFEEIKDKKLHQVSVTAICNRAKVNRTTFYAHYLDVFDLKDKLIEENLIKISESIVSADDLYSAMLGFFQCVKENRDFYLLYFEKLEGGFEDFLPSNSIKPNTLSSFYPELKQYTAEEKVYMFTYFKGGMRAICREWLISGCKEQPEEVIKTLRDCGLLVLNSRKWK